MLQHFFEEVTNIYYRYFTKSYVGGTYYRQQEMQERIYRDKNGYTY